MFQAFSRPSSGAQWLQWQPLVLLLERGDNHKFINAKQAGEIYTYKNIKQKLHKTIAAIWFNNMAITTIQR